MGRPEPGTFIISSAALLFDRCDQVRSVRGKSSCREKRSVGTLCKACVVGSVSQSEVGQRWEIRRRVEVDVGELHSRIDGIDRVRLATGSWLLGNRSFVRGRDDRLDGGSPSAAVRVLVW